MWSPMALPLITLKVRRRPRKDLKKVSDAYAEGTPPKKAPKMSKAPRVQNQQPQLFTIFLGISEIKMTHIRKTTEKICHILSACPSGTVFRQGCPCEGSCSNQNPFSVFALFPPSIWEPFTAKNALRVVPITERAIDTFQPCDSFFSRPRCQCAQGMVRGRERSLPAHAPRPQVSFHNFEFIICEILSACPAGQIFMNGGCPCPPTCVNPNPPCNFQCSQQSRCQCAQCAQCARTMCRTEQLHYDQCVSTCPVNQYFNTCPPPAGCEPSCQNYFPNCNWFACTCSRCTCRPGFYR
ncbi:hypothetical protein PRIPAC_82556 [Pristionchus pacificus]|uniref:Uncharacterized protein n=1 Tax=Pristionchus pacificus TaxID=54126 RepID=A0A2A6CNS1_PRIPA|nr:hypothetical protein PRIPAC_82556 [Pristionchus pacificus]|eukprot:PDM79779.1 hypothetical protein PRIPAC_32358 [Pristionchus pacificus]